MVLKKADIIKSIQDQIGFTEKQSTDIFESVLESIKQSLETEEDVLISGFGKFRVKRKNAKRGRNPQTGESVILEARKVVTFHCSRKLKESLNEK